MLLTIATVFSIACVSPDSLTSSRDRNTIVEEGIVRAYYSAINSNNESALASLLSDDIKIIDHTTSWDKAREIFLLRDMWSFSSVSDWCFHVNKIWALGGTVKVYADQTYSIKGKLQKSSRNALFKIKNNKIVMIIY